MKDLMVAAVCMHSVPDAVDANLDRMGNLALEAAARKAKLVCFPEMAVTGYRAARPVTSLAGQDWERALRRLQEIACRSRTIILAGLAEGGDGQAPYITQAVIAPSGLLGLYRKTHLSPPERSTYQPGSDLPVFRCGEAVFGLQICYEAHFPEISTILALKGAEVIFLPHASPRGTPEEKLASWMRHLQARAFDNAVFTVACNQVGGHTGRFSFPGAALILGPDGHVLAQYAGEQEQILVAELKGAYLEEVRSHRMRYFLPHRRPDLYGSLVQAARPRKKAADTA